MFVEATTDDFLHSDAVDMEKYYSELLDLDTRSDLEEPATLTETASTTPSIRTTTTTGRRM